MSSKNAFAVACEQAKIDAENDLLMGSYLCGPGTDHVQLGKLVTSYCRSKREAKAFLDRAAIDEAEIKSHCDSVWADRLSRGIRSAPVKLVNLADKEALTYVVQDRTESSPLKPEQIEKLEAIVGEQELAGNLVERYVYSFDPEILALKVRRNPSVRRVVSVESLISEAIAGVVSELLEAGSITTDQATRLVRVETRVTLAPGFIARLPGYCDRSAEVIRNAVHAAGSAIVRFLKAA